MFFLIFYLLAFLIYLNKRKTLDWLKDNQKKPIVTMIIMIFVATVVTVILNLIEENR